MPGVNRYPPIYAYEWTAAGLLRPPPRHVIWHYVQSTTRISRSATYCWLQLHLPALPLWQWTALLIATLILMISLIIPSYYYYCYYYYYYYCYYYSYSYFLLLLLLIILEENYYYYYCYYSSYYY